MTSAKEPKDWSLVSRAKGPSPIGTSLFVGLRAADAALQYTILRRGWAHSLITSLGGTPVALASPRDATLAYFGLSPYSAIISAMALGSSVKQIAWILGISEQVMTPEAAVAIAFFNTVCNTLNSLLSVWAITSAAPVMGTQSAGLRDVVTASPSLMVGLGLYVVGITTEYVSEVQRKRFKSRPENKGKPYGGGLWSLATNINYGGYTLWRAGAAMSAAGWPWGAAVGGWAFYEFTTRAIPVMDKYCDEQYGESYKEIKKRVHYRLLPFIY